MDVFVIHHALPKDDEIPLRLRKEIIASAEGRSLVFPSKW